MSEVASKDTGAHGGDEHVQGSDPQKRLQIVNGAMQVFMTSGFAGASMGEIARVAGVSKGTLYVYFQNKEQLFAECIDEKRRAFVEPLLDFEAAGTLEEALTRFGLGFSRFTASAQAIMAVRTVIGIAEQMPDMGCRFYDKGPHSLVPRFADYLEKQVAAGRLTAPDATLAAVQFLDLCQSTLWKPQLFGASVTHEEIQDRSERVVASAVHMFMSAYGVPAAADPA
ncbi:transcriptional regulator, TetR family [Faunimonas pinastri]|uniref:Transcriptional regulator, TetR family n=1 Tax=Faunimonas pinastri TaxID=1855383 RepID=A0A1H9A3M3_9HYPH|nr:TetR/AcrR family transcriptional regulator [Faunimonas pinastri]SEP71111.1 transcriptional regulator, TetR family [Faunimonas pinastri]